MDRDGASADDGPPAGTSAGDDCGTTAGPHTKRDSVATSTSPDPAGADARGYSCPGASKRGRSPSAEAHHSCARRTHGATPAIPPRYVAQAPSALVLLQSPQQR